MYWIFKYIFVLCLALWISYYRQRVSKLNRTRTKGLSDISTSSLNITDGYYFYNRSEQNQNAYLEFKHTVYKQGLCGNLEIPPLKRPCTPYVHIHPYQIEKFILLQGQLSYQLGDKIYSCNIHTCPSPIIIPPLVPHTFWMNDNKEDLILIVRIEPTYKTHGLRAESFENIVGTRRDEYMNIWQAFVFIDNIESYPVALPLFITKLLIKTGSLIGQLLGYRIEYEEYTTTNF
ncbi:unnamed protein product [Adineta steineri]|uniref:Cupin 2 conserved barrel domain-containing protein n=1 Tax=Adineta steineri TaxID=433720 RepID=A0A814UPZ1_9BILA|nr:unnamed protein product [Adineta steineri]CAF1180218.1 unnamed protein product [Adineta steineri]CAF3540982.1 unnamed protein product [Adineta steineri]CAF3805991.1 unnamed protein product [Adineta steineri]